MIPSALAVLKHLALIGVLASIVGLLATARADTLSDHVELCVACHGEHGVPQDRSIPVIDGQKRGYLYLQLRDYKNGDRRNDVMSPIAEALERADMMALAEYFSKRPWPNLRQPRPTNSVVARALRANASIGCTGCHLGTYPIPSGRGSVSGRVIQEVQCHGVCMVGCVGCGSEPRNDELAGAETVLMVERNMCKCRYARHCRPAGVKGHITRKRIASEAGISRDWPSVSRARDGPHREGEEP